MTSVPAFKRIQLGTHRSGIEYSKALKAAGHHIGIDADYILCESQFSCAPKKTMVSLVNLSVAELGFEKGADSGIIRERGLRMGLTLCAPEVGPALRLAYNDQPRDNWLIIAMKTILGPSGNNLVFGCVRHDQDLWLYGLNGEAHYFYPPDFRFIFGAPLSSARL